MRASGQSPSKAGLAGKDIVHRREGSDVYGELYVTFQGDAHHQLLIAAMLMNVINKTKSLELCLQLPCRSLCVHGNRQQSNPV